MPSSPRTRERQQRAQRMFRLPRGYHRVSESNLLQLLGGSKTRLSQPLLPQGKAKACSDGKRDAYYDIYVREQIDRASFTLLNFHMDDVEAFTYMDSPPDALHERLIDLPCMIVCPPNLQPGPRTGVKRFNVHYYCRHHKRAESFTMYPSYAVAISAFRPSQETWLKLFDSNNQRSHLCHNSLCEHPLHSIPETSEKNHNRNLCRFKAAGLGERYDGRTAAANTYDHCPHEPPCFSYNARLIAGKKEYNAEAFRLAMRTHGMCNECKLDFPVPIGRPTIRKGTELYSRNGRTDGCVADEWHLSQWGSSMLSPSLRWFDVLHQHRTQVHLGIDKGKEVWANMMDLQDPWWDLITAAPKKSLCRYGTNTNT